MRGSSLSLLLAALLLPSAALADRVVVGPIRGDRNGSIGRRLDSALSERLDVIPWEDFLVGYREIGGSTPNADAVRTACRNVRARRVVLGDVNSRRTVHLTALSCQSGEPDVELEVLLYNGNPERAALLDALSMLVPEEGAETTGRHAHAGRGVEEVTRTPRRGDPEPPAEEEETEEVAPESEEEGAEPEDGEVEPLPPESDAPAASVQDSAYLASSFDSSSRRSSLSVSDDESVGAEVGSDANVDAAGGTPLSSVLEASAGFIMATRSLTVPLSTGESVAYSGGGYTEVGVQVAAFPLAAFVKQSWARMFGLTGAFYQGVFMPVSGTNLQTSAVDGYFGAVGRIELGTKPIFDIRPSFTWGWWGFAISPNPDIATFNYRFLRLGMEARVHLMDRRVSIGVQGGYRLVSDLGEATTSYGNKSAGAGWDVGASASIVLVKILELSAGGELVSFDGVYAGTGSLAEREAISSADSYPRGFLRAGIVLR